MVNTTVRFLKAWVEDPTTDRPLPLFFHRRTVVDEEAEPEQFLVEKILWHKTVGGKLKFKTCWKGYPHEEATWEGAESFLAGLNTVWKEYCARHGISVDVIGDIFVEE